MARRCNAEFSGVGWLIVCSLFIKNGSNYKHIKYCAGFTVTGLKLLECWIITGFESTRIKIVLMSCICLACSYFENSLGTHKIVDQPDVIILTLGDTILALCVAICRSETLCILAFYMLSREWRWRT